MRPNVLGGAGTRYFARLGLIAADTFENAKAVLERIAHKMDMGIAPLDDRPVHPNLFCIFQAFRSPNALT
jgi:hypothetical protein